MKKTLLMAALLAVVPTLAMAQGGGAGGGAGGAAGAGGAGMSGTGGTTGTGGSGLGGTAGSLSGGNPSGIQNNGTGTAPGTPTYGAQPNNAQPNPPSQMGQ